MTDKRWIDVFITGIAEGKAFADLKLDEGDAKEDSVNVTLAQSLTVLTADQARNFRALGALPMDTLAIGSRI